MRRFLTTVLITCLIMGSMALYGKDSRAKVKTDASSTLSVQEGNSGVALEKGRKKTLSYLLIAGGAVALGMGTYLLFKKTGILGQGTVAVHIESDPSGATLFVDGEEAGVTPLDLKLKAGTHKLKLVKELVGQAEKEIEFKSGKRYDIRVSLSGYKYEFVAKWGKFGHGNGEFYGPVDVAVDKNGFVYVVDSGNYRIQKFTSDGKFVTQWGSLGDGNGQFRAPAGIAVDKNGYVYVTDTENNCVQKFTSDGVFVKKWGRKGSGKGEFNGPQGIDVDEDGFVYVADNENNRIQKFTSDGEFVASWSKDPLWYPTDVAADPENEVLYVAAYYIYKFSTAGKLLDTIENVRPQRCAVDHEGNVYASDFIHGYITKLTSDGRFLTKIGQSGSEDGKFKGPLGLTVDKNGYLYVADGGNNRIQKFAITSIPEGPGSWIINEVASSSRMNAPHKSGRRAIVSASGLSHSRGPIRK